MTKFIDKNPQGKDAKDTVFTKYVDIDLGISEAALKPYQFYNVEFIGHSSQYGDVFKTWDNDPNEFTLYFGIKGEEEYVNA